jgi:thiol-disulfide isomerase/thioredoxin
MFARFQSRAAEIQVRKLYATALDHAGNAAEANRQRALARSLADPEAPGNARRLENLKADVLTAQIDQPAHFPSSDYVQIVAFWADWCVVCKPELEQLAHYSHQRAKILTLDADHLDPALREYGQPTLPQLYVVDSAGHIRFHIAGFEDDHLFTRKLDWMVEAALHEPQR